jgi:hypothetical protein
MPKKTKRQKILAQRRRRIQLTSSSVTPSDHIPETTLPAATFHFQEPHAPMKHVENADDREELGVIKKDLTKTLILASIAVVFELVMYRVLHGT